jgi:RNA polymerase sigma factor (sigma-70 family)
MDARVQRSRRKRPKGSGRRSIAPTRSARLRPASDSAWIGEVLGQWQAKEIRLARGYSECRGLSREQLEDIYQETTVALLRRPYETEEHLHNALRTGLKHRALNLHRDERRRGQILAHNAAGMHAAAEAGACNDTPEVAAIVHQDRQIVSEFLTELRPIEQRVFWLLADGMQYRAIAPVLGIEVNVARNASRAVERKRERFQLLYDTGRLCGFRSTTILALQAGQATPVELAERAFAHLDRCVHCRAEHQTNAGRLRQRFQGQATALLPMPALVGHLGWLTRLDARLRTGLYRVLPNGAPIGSGDVRERAVALLAGAGVTAKAAATVATVAVIAGGATATVVSDHGGHPRRAPHRSLPARQRAEVAPSPMSRAPIIAPTVTSVVASARTGSIVRDIGAGSTGPREQREPGGFAYLGLPRSRSTFTSTVSARIASHGGETVNTSSGGGEFSP